MGQLDGKVAIVTGAGRGIGKAIAKVYAREGAKVCVASRTPANVATVVDEIKAEGNVAIGVPTDVGKKADIWNMVAKTVEAFGPVDILVNNAGMSPLYSSLADVTEDLFDKVIGVNLKGPFRLSVNIGTRMMAAGGGSIINVSSVASHRPSPGEAPYAAAKAGINSLTKSLAAAFGPTVRVNCIVPGPFLTDISKAWDMTTFNEHAKTAYALGRGGQPHEIVGAALYFASDASSYTTGALLDIDGLPR